MLEARPSTAPPAASRIDRQWWPRRDISAVVRGVLWLRRLRRPCRPARAAYSTYLYWLVFWAALALLIGLLSGLAAAGFLFALDQVTQVHTRSPWFLLLGLPLVGFFVGWLYHCYGGAANAGTEAVVAQVRHPTQRLPWQMAPLVLFGTLLTHLCGGSVGREGTAIQMSAALADRWSAWLALRGHDRRTLLTMGISAGFAGLFGTPWAAALFAIEFPAANNTPDHGWAATGTPGIRRIGTVDRTQAPREALGTKKSVQLSWIEKNVHHSELRGRLRPLARLVMGLLAAVCADMVCRATGASHAVYPDSPEVTWGFVQLSAAIGCGLLCGGLATGYKRLHQGLQAGFRAWISYPPLRPVVGGVGVILLVGWLGTTRYNGLGLPVIEQALHEPVEGLDFVWKTILTTWTLAAGFKGGEVTPLFFIGATFGNALHGWLPLPMGLLSSLGFVAVFAGVTRTPWACTLMGCELFGWQAAPFLALASLGSAHGFPHLRHWVLSYCGYCRNRDSGG